jgi:hypothetical protein
MIPPRLSDEEIVATPRMLTVWEVAFGDRRLAHLEEWTCRCTALAIPDSASFVLWPDMTLGFVVFAPDTSTHCERLVDEYRSARESLELLALDFFYLFDRSRPQ